MSLYLEAAKILTYTALAYLLAMWWAPSLIKLLVWLKFWKKKSRDITTTGEKLIVTKKFYQDQEEKTKTPRAGGLLIWITALVFATGFWIILKIEPDNKLTQFLNFVSRRETFIPIGTLFFGSVLGFIDDALATLDTGGNYKAGGLKLSYRLGLVTVISVAIGIWFYFKLNLVDVTLIPNLLNLKQLQIYGVLQITSWIIIPATVLVLLGLWSSSIIDGFDGLAAGTFIPIYLCFAALAFARGFYDTATLMMVMVGGMTAYLWYNIPPAKFTMGETGAVGILLTLGVVAFLIDAVYILPIAGFMLVLTSASAIIQIFSKKVFKRKVFLAAPLHHHLEAIGWERNQITMRYWLVSIMCSVLGLAIGLLVR
jgi:phospho-N-acetylmuramoyl-pentapeptide-transferase